MSNNLMVVITKKTRDEGQELKTLVNISAPPATISLFPDTVIPSPTGAFKNKLVTELHEKGKLSILTNPPVNASSVTQRTINMLLSLNHAVEIDADIIICVTCRNAEPPKELALEKSEKGYRPVLNVLSRELVDTIEICKDLAYVRKFPAEMESSVLEVMEGLADKGFKRVTRDIIDKKFEETRGQESRTHHFIRKTLGGISTSERKLIFEIEVFPRNPEETAIAAHECAEIIERLRKFNSAKNDWGL